MKLPKIENGWQLAAYAGGGFLLYRLITKGVANAQKTGLENDIDNSAVTIAQTLGNAISRRYYPLSGWREQVFTAASQIKGEKAYKEVTTAYLKLYQSDLTEKLSESLGTDDWLKFKGIVLGTGGGGSAATSELQKWAKQQSGKRVAFLAATTLYTDPNLKSKSGVAQKGSFATIDAIGTIKTSNTESAIFRIGKKYWFKYAGANNTKIG